MDNAWDGDSRPWRSLSIWTVLGLDILFHVNFLFSRVFSHVKRGGTLAFRCVGSQTLLTSLFKDASFIPLLNLQRVFHLWKSIDLNIVWVDIF